MKKILYIILLFSTICFAQQHPMLLASQQQFANEGGGVPAVPIIESTENSIVAWSNGVIPTEIIVNKPTGVASGDLILIVASLDINDTEWSSDAWDATYKPTGFTIVSQTVDITRDVRFGVFYKISDGTEGSSFTIPLDKETTSTAHGAAAFCARISGVNSNPIDQIGAERVSGNIIPSITTSEDLTLAMYAVVGDGSDMSPFADQVGWTELVDLQSNGVAGSGASLAVGSKDMTTAGATGDIEPTPSSVDGLTGLQFNLKSI